MGESDEPVWRSSPNRDEGWVTFVLLVVFFGMASLMWTAIAVLANLGAPTSDIDFQELEAGNLLPMFLGGTFWGTYPQFPSSVLEMWSLPSGIYLILTACIVRFLLRPLLALDFRQQLGVVFGLSLLPLFAGRLYLMSGPSSPVNVGLWISFMINSALYASLMCGCLLLYRPVGIVSWWKLQAHLQQLDVG